MPQPLPGDVHVNAILSSIATAYLQDLSEFIAGIVFPTVPVNKQSDLYFIYAKDQWFRTDAKPRAPGAESEGSGYAVSTDSYSAKVWAIHKLVDDQLRSNADAPINLDRDATEFVTRDLLLQKEIAWATKYFGTSIWTGASDKTPSPKWDAASSTPIKDLRAGILGIKVKTGFRPNTLVLAEDSWSALQDNADFLDRIAVTQRKIVNAELLASVLGIDRVLVAGAVKNTALEGATAAMASVFSKQALLCYSAPRPSIMMPSAGYTFAWSGYLGASPQGLRIKRFRIEPKASDCIEGELAYDHKLVASDLGAFFTATIS